MKVLVTGAAGLYGVHLVNQLLKEQAVSKVVAVDNYSRQYLTTPPFLGDDFSNQKFVMEQKNFRRIKPSEIDEQGIDVVVHLAAYISVPESMKSPEDSKKYFLNNELGTFELMQTLLKTEKHPLLVYASSGKVYGEPEYAPIDLNHPMKPCNVYGATKLAGEKHVMLMNYCCGYPAVAVRNFNTYGENQNVFGDAAVISNFVTKALKNEPIIVHGDGEQTRDFNYVEDAAAAYVTICFRGAELSGKIFNLASGRSTSINELAEAVIKLTNSKSQIHHEDIRICDSVKMAADYSEIKNSIGWQPTHSLEQGLEKCIGWYEKFVSKELEAGKNGGK